MRLHENPNVASLYGQEITFDSEPNYPFVLTQHGLLGKTEAASGLASAHSGFYLFYRMLEMGRVTPEFMQGQHAVTLGNIGQVDQTQPGYKLRLSEQVDTGRIFPHQNLCSFWHLNLTKWLPPYMGLLTQYFALLHLDIKRFMFEAGAPPYQELYPFADLQTIGAAQPEVVVDPRNGELNQMQAQLHITPPGPEKAALRAKMDALRNGPALAVLDRRQTAAATLGFNSPVAYNYARRAGLGDSAKRLLTTLLE